MTQSAPCSHHLLGVPFHLDIQVQLFPQVIMQGRDLGLKVLIHYCAVGQCLREGEGYPVLRFIWST